MESRPIQRYEANVPVNNKELWKLFIDFGNWISWMPIYKKQVIISEIQSGPGCTRRDTTVGGAVYTTEIVIVQEEKGYLEYHDRPTVPVIPMIDHFINTVTITPLNDKASKIIWTAETVFVPGADRSHLDWIIPKQETLHVSGVKAAVFHCLFKHQYDAAFSLVNDRMLDLYKALIIGQDKVWHYDSYELTNKNGALPKMVVGLPAKEALPAMKLANMLGRMLEIAYLEVDRLLLSSNQIHPDGVDLYEDAALKIANTYGDDTRQQITKYLTEHWQDDTEFSQQYLQGANPIQIKAVKCIEEVPEGMRDLKVHTQSLGDLIQNKRLFIADYEILAGLKLQEGRFFYAPTVLFYNEHYTFADSRLNVFAIRLERTKDAKIYTPDMQQKNRWQYAKMCVSNADNQVHQFALHLGLAHLSMEPICVATHNAFQDQTHPIYKLLKPHLTETIGINFLARQSLIASSGPLTDKPFSIGTAQGVEIASLEYAKYEFYRSSFPEQLKSRGFDREGTDGLKYYLYRDDGFKLWDLLGDYVTDYLNATYKSCDDKVKNDANLQAWAKEMADPARAAVPGFRTEFTTIKDLALALQIIIWNGSAFHSILNFPQWPYVGNIPNRPNALHLPMPEDKGEDITKEYIKKSLAPEFETFFQFAFTWGLTLPSETSLLDLGEQQKKEGGAVGEKFHASLVKLTQNLKQRNEDLVKSGKAPYIFLMPEHVACSVDI